MFAKEGLGLIFGALTMFVILIVLGTLAGGWIGWGIMLFGLLIFGFTCWFFRDPNRTITSVDEWTLLSPADGKVVVLQEVDEPLFLKGKAKQISIFLSPLNVHVNRIPIAGTIEFDEYVPGDYLVAWHEKASELNERSQLGVRHASGQKVLFKQIAGAVARRIVYHVTVGDTVGTGERFGIVKFGSRMDILLPPDAEILVNLEDKVAGGIHPIARLAEREG
ncbi:MAG: phosphatidylserine decarboxylase family protein [Bacteroidetes bacterium]|nr:phosphatidylserine decarboxylase family protein [Bacteroidota bacterium]MDA0875023.1 phosphatidylserine decarboxylase family protein [Bacteroidota bacterium]